MERVNYKIVYVDNKCNRRFVTTTCQAAEVGGVIQDLQQQGYEVKGIQEHKERFIDIATLMLNNI